MPGTYTVKLTVDGRSYTQPLTVKIDPRVHMTRAQLAQQHSIGVRMLEATHDIAAALGKPGADSASLARLKSQALAVLDIVESADMPVTSQTTAAADFIEKNLKGALSKVRVGK